MRPRAGLFLAGVALLTIDMLSFGPFVSDYTRYLPAETNGKRLFWAIYAGNVIATIGSCAVGAYLAALLPTIAGGRSARSARISGKWALVIMALSLINACTFNAYTGAFQVLPFANMWTRLKSTSVTAARRAVRHRHGRRRRGRVLRLQVLRHQPVQLPRRPAGDLHPVVGGQPDRLLRGPARSSTTWRRSSWPTAGTAGSSGAGLVGLRDRPGRRMAVRRRSRTTPARWSTPWAARTSPGWSAGSSAAVYLGWSVLSREPGRVLVRRTATVFAKAERSGVPAV